MYSFTKMVVYALFFYKHTIDKHIEAQRLLKNNRSIVKNNKKQ